MKQKKKDELTCQAVSGRLDIFNSGGFVDCGHGILADDSGFYHVTADRFQCKHAVVRTDL